MSKGDAKEMAGQRASGRHGREKKQDRSNLSKHVQEPAIGTRSGSRGDRSGRAPAAICPMAP
jgi:hypothetical protein